MDRLIALTILIALGAMTANAQEFDSQLDFPGEIMSDRQLALTRKAEAAFESGDYEDALWYYSKELAPIGDKYAQYMVGYMTERGLGTAADTQKAAGWYMLAAERGHDPLIEHSQTFLADLSPSQREGAREAAESLRNEYGDRSLIERLIRRDIDRLRETTGSRIRGKDNCTTRSLRVYLPGNNGAGRSMDGSRYCKMLNDRIDSRIAYLAGYVTYGDLGLLPDEDEGSEENDAAGDASDEYIEE